MSLAEASGFAGVSAPWSAAGWWEDRCGSAARQRRVLESHGYRYFSWSVGGEGQLSVRVDREKLCGEMRLEGTYVIATDQERLSPLEIVQAYKELAGVERAFRESKDFLPASGGRTSLWWRCPFYSTGHWRRVWQRLGWS